VSVLAPTTDPRPVWLRGLVLVGALLLLVVGGILTALGLALVTSARGPVLLVLGLGLLGLGVGSVLREVADVRSRRNPPRPRLDQLEPGEPALVLPRASAPSLVSAWSLVVLAATCALGGVVALVAGRWVLGVVLLAAAAGGLLVAQPRRARELAGGLWCTPRRLVHLHDGVRWEIGWDDVSGVLPQEPMPILVHPGREPVIQRTAAAGRFHGRTKVDGMLPVQTRYLAGGAVLASYVVGKAAVDPQFRAALGTEASLPPPDALP
jgi:hypothetical protein